MDRKEFLRSTLAVCGLAAIPAALFESCSTTSTTGPTNVNFTLDLTRAANAALNNVGGYVYSNSVIVIRYSATAYYAFSQVCTHQGCQVGFTGTALACPCHGGMFNATTGAVISGPPNSGLTKFTVTKNGNILTVN